MKFIKVTVLSSFLSPEGEKKMIGIGGISPETKKDQYGYTVEEWEDMKVPIPEDSTHHANTIEEDIEFDDEDIEIIKSPAYFLAEDFKLVVARDDFGSTIYLKDNCTLDVMETPRQVVSKITKVINN
jgi:hypothetical protein